MRVKAALGLLLFVGVTYASESYDDYDPDLDGGDYGYGEEDAAGEEDVVVLTQGNFEGHTKTGYALVEFYAPWCGHCKQLAPEYAKAATVLKEYDPSIVIGKVDATVHSELAQDFGVQGYPTLKWFKDGTPVEYDGGRTADTIVAWVKKKTGPPSALADSQDKVEQATKSSKVVVLGYFAKLDTATHKAFVAVAAQAEAVAFLHTTDKAVAAAYGLTKDGGAVLLRDFDSGNVVMPGAVTEAELSAFVKKHQLPLVIPFNEENAETIFGAGIDEQLLFFGSSDDLEEGLPLAKQLSEQLAGRVICVSVNTDEKASENVVEFFGLAQMSKGITVMGFSVKDEQGLKYRYEGDFTLAALTEFATKMLAKELTPTYKSEAVPVKNDAPVTVVVGNNFDSIVLDPTKDVMLEVYAPWCGHCKQLAPIYKKLGKRFKDVNSVVVAKMDGTANEHPEVMAHVQGYPTLLFFPAQAGAEVVPVEEERTLGSLTKFIKDNAKVAFELPKKDNKKAAEEAAEDAKDEL